jgi:hypothetical protein
MRTRYLRITETRQGRVIEAWVQEPRALLEASEPEVEEKESPWIIASMFAWGFMGIFIGNLLVGYFI